MIQIERDPNAGEALLGALIGYRKDSDVYADIQARVDSAGSSPKTTALTDVLAMFIKPARGLTATPEPEEPEAVPPWLDNALRHVVGLPADQVEKMNLEEAHQAWEDCTTGPGSAR